MKVVPVAMIGAVAVFLCGGVLAAPAALKTWTEPNTGMVFVAVPKGCFQMGTSVKEIGKVDASLKVFQSTLAADEVPQHEVCVDAFLMSQTEVRASDWFKVTGDHPPYGKDAAPAAGISFVAAQDFASSLTKMSGGSFQFRLPTEAEWEYACRAGIKKQAMPFRDDQIDSAWYSVEQKRTAQPSPVGVLKPNAWGLFDMLGNVWEWVQDGYAQTAYVKHVLYNPLHTATSSDARVIRGASYRSDYIQLRCANRSSYAPNDSLVQIGMRLVRQP